MTYAAMTTVDLFSEFVVEVAKLLDMGDDHTPEQLLDKLRNTIDNADATAESLRESIEQNAKMVERLTAAYEARRTLFGLSARLLSQLSWCGGYLASDEQELPPEMTAVIDEAVRVLPEIDEQRERST